jgi:hypothetical protein
MSNDNVERGGCRFGVKKTSDGKPSVVRTWPRTSLLAYGTQN